MQDKDTQERTTPTTDPAEPSPHFRDLGWDEDDILIPHEDGGRYRAALVREWRALDGELADAWAKRRVAEQEAERSAS